MPWLFCLLTSGAAAAEGTEFSALKRLMSCLDDPAPTEVLSGLIAAGNLVDRIGPGFDGDYCWTIAPKFEWSGVKFPELCVVTDDTENIAAHPDLYWDEAMAPWTEVWLLAETQPAHLKHWAASTLGIDSRFEIDPIDSGILHAALSCSEWRFPLQD